MTKAAICVGVDGAKPSLAALRFALDEAKHRGAVIHVVTAWELGVGYGGYGVWLAPEEANAYEAHALVAQSKVVERALDGLSDPPEIVRHVARATPGEALVDASKDCDLLVVGTEHKGALKRVVLGSTSSHCVRHARVPVVVVPFVDTETFGPDPDSELAKESERVPADTRA